MTEFFVICLAVYGAFHLICDLIDALFPIVLGGR